MTTTAHSITNRSCSPSRILTSSIVAALVLASCGTSVKGGSEETTPEVSSPATVEALSADPRVDLPGRVSVFLQVRSGNGAPASGLTGSNFRIYENEVLVSETESSQRIIAQPQVFRSYMHLLIDRSNSVQAGGGVGEVENGAKEFIEAVALEGQNFVKISWFDGSPTIHPIAGFDFGFSDDEMLLLEAIDALNNEPPFSTSTNLYGAVVDGIEALDAEDAVAENTGVENRALSLVTFTDGTHQAGSQVSLQDAVDAIAGVSLAGVTHNAFTIGVGSEIDQAVLDALGPDGSESAADFAALEAAFIAIGDAVFGLANSFYFLSYCSPKTFGIHDLRVSVLPSPSNESDARFTFDAQYFGGGCAFLDIRNHPLLGGGNARAFVTDAIELADGTVAATGWTTNDCLEPGCGTPARAFMAIFRASPATTPARDVEDGFLQTGFGTAGIVLLEAVPFEVSGATSIEVSSSGDFIVGGWSRVSAQSGFTQGSLWSVSADGSTVVRTDMPNPTFVDQAVLDVSAVASGGYAAVGFRGVGSRSFAVWRVQNDLTPNLGFGFEGAVFDPEIPAIGGEGASDILVSGGRIYALGRVNGGIRIIAVDGAGDLDLGFGVDGRVDARNTFGGTVYDARIGSAALDGLDRILIGGTLTGSWGGTTVRGQPAIWCIDQTGLADTTFSGSLSSPTFGTGVVTLREGSTSNPDIDFGRDTRIKGMTIAPDGTLLATGSRLNAAGHTDMVQFSFSGTSGVLQGSYNFLGFLIDDGATADDSFESGANVLVLGSGAIWTLGVSNPEDPTAPGGTADVPTIWVDRDPARAFPPLGQ